MNLGRSLIIVLFLMLECPAFGQKQSSFETWKANTLAEISADGISTLHLGWADCVSKSRRKADSLFAMFSADTAWVYTKNNSYTIRYYAFLRLLTLDQSLAFACLKDNILDSTWIEMTVPCMSVAAKFNELLASEYKRFVYYQSKGRSFRIDGRFYRFIKADRKKGIAEFRRFEELVKSAGWTKQTRRSVDKAAGITRRN